MLEGAVAVVLAAGVGSRLGHELPKQFVELNGAPVLARTVASLAWCGRIVVVHHPAHAERTSAAVDRGGASGRVLLVPGGATRRLSVSAALRAVEDLADDVPLVLQNAASPNTPREVFDGCLEALSTHEVAQAYVRSTHTVFSHAAGELVQVLDRSSLGYSADPTAYRLGCLRRIAAAQASGSARGEMTLDTARALGIPVRLVPSPETNLKLTTGNDLVLLRALVPPARG